MPGSSTLEQPPRRNLARHGKGKNGLELKVNYLKTLKKYAVAPVGSAKRWEGVVSEQLLKRGAVSLITWHR